MSLQFSYDEARDVLTIEGIRYSGELFRGIGLETPVGAWIQIVKREDGVVTLRMRTADHASEDQP